VAKAFDVAVIARLVGIEAGAAAKPLKLNETCV
jgi:hypothetical protein